MTNHEEEIKKEFINEIKRLVKDRSKIENFEDIIEEKFQQFLKVSLEEGNK